MLKSNPNSLLNNQQDEIVLAKSFNEFNTRKISNVSNPILISFEDLIKSGSCIDKTRHYMSLLSGGKKIFMLGESSIGKTVTLSAIEFLAKGQIAKQQLSGYNITSYHWENEFGNYLDEHGCPIHIQNDLLMKNTTLYPFKKYPVIRLDFDHVIHNNLEEPVNAFYKLLQTNVYRYNLEDVYKPEKKVDSIKDDFTQVIMLLTKLGQGYERRVIILLDNVDHFSEEYARYRTRTIGTGYQNIELISKIIKSFYQTIKNCSNDIHTVLAFGKSLNRINFLLKGIGNLHNETNTPLYHRLFGITIDEIKNSFTEDLFVKCFDLKHTKEEQNTSKKQKIDYILGHLKRVVETQGNENVYQIKKVMSEIYKLSNPELNK